jgi:hypothetical protein
MVDVETDGPAPGLFSMIELGAVVVDYDLNKTFYYKFRPLLEANYVQEALNVSGYSREQTMQFPEASEGIAKFDTWLSKVKNQDKLMFISDNNGFDWQFVNYYFYKYLGKNPFGHSSTNLGSLYKGLERSMFENFKHLRKTKHTHNPVDDAMGNAEALLYMRDKMNLRIKL